MFLFLVVLGAGRNADAQEKLLAFRCTKENTSTAGLSNSAYRVIILNYFPSSFSRLLPQLNKITGRADFKTAVFQYAVENLALHFAKEARFIEHRIKQALVNFTKRCMCQTIHDTGPGVGLDANQALDIVYIEYSRRGIEKHYDIAADSVVNNPDWCDAA